MQGYQTKTNTAKTVQEVVDIKEKEKGNGVGRQNTQTAQNTRYGQKMGNC